MGRYIAARVIQGLFILAVMSFVIFALIALMPGDPIEVMIASNPELTAADAVRLRTLHGLDLPLMERYGNWLAAVSHGDFGYSRNFSRPVFEILLPRLGNTVILLGVSSLLAIAVAIPLGIAAAVRPHSWVDNAINLFCFAGVSVPPFWFAILLILLFAVFLGILPAGGVEPIDGGGVLGRVRHLILPVTALATASLAGFTRFMRASMTQELRQDYIRTAWAKGLTRRHVVYLHAARNALLPLVTIIALDFGSLFSGALVTETVFAYLGMGKLIVDAILGNDFNLALVALLLATAVVLIGNFLADVGYAFLDPRINYRALEESR